MYSSSLYRTSCDHFKTSQEILQFTNKFIQFIICFGMTQTKENQDGRNEFERIFKSHLKMVHSVCLHDVPDSEVWVKTYGIAFREIAKNTLSERFSGFL